MWQNFDFGIIFAQILISMAFEMIDSNFQGEP